MSRQRRPIAVAEPRREELEALALQFRHLAGEHTRAAPGTSARRRHEARMVELLERFERRLDEWLADPQLRLEWRAFLHGTGPEPALPAAVRPLVFRGRSELAGSIVEVRGQPDDLTVEVDGALVERVAAARDFSGHRPPVRFRVAESDFVEIFGASTEALQALAEFCEGSESPPWQYASELFEDGLVRVRFDLTPRGHRALAAGHG